METGLRDEREVKMTAGEWMFYGGIAGTAVSIVGFIIWKIVLAAKKKNLKKDLEAEYFSM